MTGPPYIYRMKSILFAIAALSIGTAAFGQNMMQSATKAGSTGSMMSSNTMAADPKVGAELRAAMSNGHKLIYTTIEAAEALAAKAPTVLFFAADWCPYLPG